MAWGRRFFANDRLKLRLIEPTVDRDAKGDDAGDDR
jgi:hypothetical protein